MKHSCSTIVFRCMDFRFGPALESFLDEQGLSDDADLVSLAGSAKNLVSPANPADAELFLRQIDISRRLHHSKKIILINHTDCGAYGGRKAFESGEAEDQKHFGDLRTARMAILEKFPDAEVRLVLARITEEGVISFEEVGV